MSEQTPGWAPRVIDAEGTSSVKMYPLQDKTEKAIRFFCWTVGLIALLYLLLVALIAGLLLFGGVNALTNSDDAAATEQATEGSIPEELNTDQDGRCNTTFSMLDPDCPDYAP